MGFSPKRYETHAFQDGQTATYVIEIRPWPASHFLAPVEGIQSDQNSWQQEIPIYDDTGITGGEIIVLQHVKYMSESSSPHESCLGDDER